MARRRMISLDVVDTDIFLDMPQSTQNLYFHFAVRADDDGFVANPKKIIKIIGAADDDLKILLVKNFVIIFDSGICVIRHWKIHNYIQADRYKESIYSEEKKQLLINDSNIYLREGECIQDVSKPDTQVRLGKVRLDKNSIENTNKKLYEEFVYISDIEYNKLIKKYDEQIIIDYIKRVNNYIGERQLQKKYKSHYHTIIKWLQKDKVQEKIPDKFCPICKSKLIGLNCISCKKQIKREDVIYDN